MTQTDPRLPRLARTLVERCLPAEAAEAIVGDLDERCRADLDAGVPPVRARARYWRHAIASVAAMRRCDPSTVETMGKRRLLFLPGLVRDGRVVLRGLARSPGYVVVAMLSLAIGIGSNVATLSVLRAVVLEELPVTRPGELQWVNWTHASGRHANNYNSTNDSNYSYPAYLALRRAEAGIPLLGFNFTPHLVLIASGRAPIDAYGMIVSADYFATLGLSVAAGRPLGPADEESGAPLAAVISDDLWLRLFDRDPAAVGASIRINGADVAVVGVAPRHYTGLSIGGFFRPTDITLPLRAQPIAAPNFAGDEPILQDVSRQWIHVIARLTPSVDVERFRQAAMTSLAPIDAELASGGPAHGSMAVTFSPANRGVDDVARRAGEPLDVLSGASVLVLLIACANLAGLMLARGVARSRETAVRRALGASRWTLARQWLVESVLLAAGGGLCGVVVAIWSGPAIVRLLTTGLGPVSVDIRTDWRFIALACGLTLVTALLSAVVPVWRLSRGGVTADRRTQVIGASSPRLTIGRILIAIQIAVSVPLLVGALLFLRTLRNLSAVELGFDPRGVVEFQLNLPRPSRRAASAAQTPSAETSRLLTNLVAAIEAIPGVSSATFVENPLVSGISSNTNVTVGGASLMMSMEAVGPRFFETMRIPLLAGRAMSWQDVADVPAVAVVNRSAVDVVFHGASPIGRTLHAGGRDLIVVGIVADAVYSNLRRRPKPTFYDAYLQRPGAGFLAYMTIRTTIASARLVGPITTAVARVDPTLPVAGFQTQDDQIAQTTGQERVFSRLLTLFAAFAILLAGIGLYGLTAYAVARRRNEIGIRLALGAARSQVERLILRNVVVLAVAGLAAGIPLALLATRFVAALVFGVTPRDPVTFAIVSVTMVGAATIAGWIPARRAARLEPFSALRAD